MRAVETMTEIAPNVYKASEKCYYIRIASGEIKFCSAERFEKLLARHNGDTTELVEKYRTRHTTGADPQTRIAKLKAELAALESAQPPVAE